MAKSRAGVWRFVIVSLWLAACGGAVGQTTVGGESHFLRECGAGCGSGLECVSGVCTRGCLVGKSKCDDLSPSAVCTAASIEPGTIAVCDVACSPSVSCSELGRDFHCEAGFCRDSAAPNGTGGATGTAGTAGAAAAGGTTSVAGASGAGPVEPALYETPNCLGGGTLTPCSAGMACVDDPRTMANAVPTAICVQESVVGQCEKEATTCQDGFVCVRGSCSPDRVDCVVQGPCPELPEPTCPYGYARARVDPEGGVPNCSGPCVPLTHCGCSNDAGCPDGSVCRDGGCLAKLPWQPPAYCSLPFDRGICDDVLSAYAAVDGVCTKVTYGGCGGNDNRFGSLEECLAICEGKPVPGSCPEGRVSHYVCTACGLGGGCRLGFTACALPCTLDEECGSSGMSCIDGVCQMGHCI